MSTSKISLAPDVGWGGDPKRGSALGRISTPLQGKGKLQAMKMSPCGAYDEGGTYWGAGDGIIGFMYVAEDADGNQAFVRARNRGKAKEEVLKNNPDVKFYR